MKIWNIFVDFKWLCRININIQNNKTILKLKKKTSKNLVLKSLYNVNHTPKRVLEILKDFLLKNSNSININLLFVLKQNEKRIWTIFLKNTKVAKVKGQLRMFDQ